MKRIIKTIFCCFLLFILIIYLDKTLQETTNGEDILSFIINSNNYSSAKKSNKILENIFDILTRKDVLDPNNLFINNNEKQVNIGKPVSSTRNEIKDDKPLIYLYSTHQTEEYTSLKNELYNFKPTVMTASFILEDLLEKKGISVIVEQKSIKEVLNKRNWDYSYSYRISREYMEQAKKENPSLKIFIDMHRDSVPSKSIVSANIDKEPYAKLMFLIGKNRKNYEENLKTIKKLENDLEKNYKGIMRPTYYQKLYDYNQDFSNDTYLIEIGANQNTIDEVYNSMVALADTLERYVKGKL